MRMRFQSGLCATIVAAIIMAWTLSAQAQVIIIQPNQDDSCAISFDENFNQVNIGRYVGKKKSWCGVHSKPACHLPEWDCQGSGLLFFASDTNVVADAPLHNCSSVLFESASNASLSDADIDGAFAGIAIYGGSNITLKDLSFQGANDILGRALDIQGAQGVKASGLRFKGDFDRINVASSSDVSVESSYFELADGAGFSNIFESTDVSFSWIAIKGGNALMSAFNATNASLSHIAIKLGGEAAFPTVSVFDSSGIHVDHVLMDRRDVASAQCVNINGTTDVTIESSACLSDPANNSGEALVLTQVYDFLVSRNLFDGNSNGLFINSDGYIPNEGEISKNTINTTGPYGLFLSAVTDVDVIKNNVTNTLGTGGSGAWYYDELTDGTQLIINFQKNKYSGFAFNGECNSLDEICP